MGCAGEMVDGVMYDKVLPIEIEDVQGGTGIRRLKIGFNEGDNPFVVAQQLPKTSFSHGLHRTSCQYIQNNRGPAIPTIDMSSYGQKGGDMTVSEMLGGTAPATSSVSSAGASKSSPSSIFPPKSFQCFTNI